MNDRTRIIVKWYNIYPHLQSNAISCNEREFVL